MHSILLSKNILTPKFPPCLCDDKPIPARIETVVYHFVPWAAACEVTRAKALPQSCFASLC